MFGAAGNGADDTLALRAALATDAPVYLPGRYRITGSVRVGRQLLFGSSSRVSGLVVDHEFDPTTPAVVEMTGGEPGGELRDISVLFSQPDTSDRSKLIRYPAAIRAGIPRFKLSRLRIERPMIAIDMRGNAGGATLDDIEISAFERSIWIDGALDSVKISKLHVWPFGMTPAQRRIYSDEANIGLLAGKCDDLHFSDSIIFGIPKAASFVKTSRGTTFGNLSGVNFDHWGGLEVAAGNLRIVACSFTAGERSARWLRLGEVAVTLSSCWLHAVVDLERPGIELGYEGTAMLAMNSVFFSTGRSDFVHLEAGPASMLNISDVNVKKAADMDYRNPLFRFRRNSTITLSQIIVSDIGRRTGSLIEAEPGARGSISTVDAGGWQGSFGTLVTRDIALNRR